VPDRLVALTDSAPRFVDALPRTADVVVVGGGVAGCATAFFAALSGLDVLVLERRPALATLTTAASTGAFRLQFDNPDEIALVREGIELFDDFGSRRGLEGWDLRLRHGGYLFCSLTPETVDRAGRLVERQRAWGLTDVELLSGDEARRRWPYLSDAVVGARYRAADGWLDVKRLAIGYAAAAAAPPRAPGAIGSGSASFCAATEVHGFAMSADGSAIRGVRTSRGDVASEAVVVAAGPFAAQVAALAGTQIALEPTRRQKLVIPDLPEAPPGAPMTIEEESAAHWRPAHAGCLALFTDARARPTAPADPVPIDAAWAFGLLDPTSDHGLGRVAPFWNELWARGSVAHWYVQAGQYEYTPDRRPYLGAVGSIGPSGLYLNAGYSGHGIMASAGGSRLVVDQLTGRGAVPTVFAVDRALLAGEHDIL